MEQKNIFNKIILDNVTKCICTNTYIHNNTVVFKKGHEYLVDLRMKKDSDLIAVIQPDYPAYVGMSKTRFLHFFEIKEKEFEIEEIDLD